MRSTIPLFMAMGAVLPAQGYLSDIPGGFNGSQWAYLSYSNPSVAVLPGTFNRSAMEAPHEGEASDAKLMEA